MLVEICQFCAKPFNFLNTSSDFVMSAPLRSRSRASDDAIRSLVISYKLLGTREWFVIHHTDCGMGVASIFFGWS